MRVRVLKHRQSEVDSRFSLNSTAFRNHHLALLAEELEEAEKKLPPSAPSASNNYFSKVIEKPVLDGVQLQVHLNDASPNPSIMAFFSLGREFSLDIGWEFGSLHYSDRKNPYSEELLHNMKLELFDEFLSYIYIEYSPDTLALIETLKEESSCVTE